MVSTDEETGLPLITKADLALANRQDGKPSHVAVFGFVYDVTDVEGWAGGEHNGKDGNPAYIAVNGIVYDVTNFEVWAEGEHQGMVTAGTNATEIFETQSPHDTTFLDALPIAGQSE